jgi:hypothetical protein
MNGFLYVIYIIHAIYYTYNMEHVYSFIYFLNNLPFKRGLTFGSFIYCIY